MQSPASLSKAHLSLWETKLKKTPTTFLLCSMHYSEEGYIRSMRKDKEAVSICRNFCFLARQTFFVGEETALR